MKTQTLKEDILPILVILFTALLFSFKFTFSATPSALLPSLPLKSLSPVIPAVATFDDAVPGDQISLEEAIRNLVPTVPAEASFEEPSEDFSLNSTIHMLAPLTPAEADFE